MWIKPRQILHVSDIMTMSYNDIVNSKSYMDLLGKTLGRNKAFGEVLEGYEFNLIDKNKYYDHDCGVKVKTIYQRDIEFNELRREVEDDIKIETVKRLQSIECDGSVKSLLEDNLSFVYPYREEIGVHSKVSVTELKKQSMTYEEELDGYAVYGDKQGTTEAELIPSFAKKDAESGNISGAARGTAYHRVFELLDMSAGEYSVESIRYMIEGYIDKGMIDEIGARAVEAGKIYEFTKSRLFERMRDAHMGGQLFRERNFLLGVPAGQINQNISSDDTMIIQGIIDVCFIENDKYVIADYKTDRITDTEELIRKYRIQLECYSMAIKQITGKDVEEMIIYSVFLGKEITLKGEEE